MMKSGTDIEELRQKLLAQVQRIEEDLEGLKTVLKTLDERDARDVPCSGREERSSQAHYLPYKEETLRNSVLMVLSDHHPAPVNARRVAKAVLDGGYAPRSKEKFTDAVHSVLSMLRRDGRAIRLSRGLYCFVNSEDFGGEEDIDLEAEDEDRYDEIKRDSVYEEDYDEDHW